MATPLEWRVKNTCYILLRIFEDNLSKWQRVFFAFSCERQKRGHWAQLGIHDQKCGKMVFFAKKFVNEDFFLYLCRRNF